ncbi:hypothetical protein FH5_03574 [Priestia endophytica]|nr:hypothetical protein FH5_03574 [Priestia endophytica]
MVCTNAPVATPADAAIPLALPFEIPLLNTNTASIPGAAIKISADTTNKVKSWMPNKTINSYNL